MMTIAIPNWIPYLFAAAIIIHGICGLINKALDVLLARLQRETAEIEAANPEPKAPS